jgi:uncharacterized membrane protein
LPRPVSRREEVYEELKVLHVLAVVLLGGTITVDTLAGVLMPRARSMAELRAFARMSRTNQYLGWASILLVPLFGYGAAADADLELGSGWLLWGQVLFWVAVVISQAVLTPGALRLARKAESLPDGPISDEVMRELRNPVFPALGGLLTIFFVVIVYLMVAKPDL